MVNPNDEIRDKILRFLYGKHKSARGPRAVAVGIRELQKAMKERHGIEATDVNSNLDYLVQKQWVQEVVEERTFITPGGTAKQQPKRTYKISHIGIDRLEGASIYDSPSTSSAINITNIQGVTVVGSGNVVNTRYTDLARFLSELEQAVLDSAELSPEAKLNIVADVRTMQAQLSKPEPSFDVIRGIWRGLRNNLLSAGLTVFVDKIGSLVGQAL